IFSMYTSYARLDKNLEDALMERYRAEIQHMIESLVSLIDNHLERFKTVTSPADLEEQVKDMVRKARFAGTSGYFFLYDFKGNNLAHGSNQTREGRNWWTDSCPNDPRPKPQMLIQDLHRAAVK